MTGTTTGTIAHDESRKGRGSSAGATDRRYQPAEDPTLMHIANDRLWTVTDIAAYLAVSRRTAQSLIAGPDFPPRVVLGERTHRWVPDDVQRWARSRRGHPPHRHVDALS